ncbi:MAG: zinc-binding dehydrogenase [Spirochaetota bacterium]
MALILLSMQMMQAAVTQRAGGIETIQVKEVAIPQVKPGWVLIQVKASGLNRSEMYTRQGHSPKVKFPRIQGIECVGVVADASDSSFSVGQQVIANMGELGREFDGGYAQYCLAPTEIVCSFTSNLPWEILGALPEMYNTTYGSVYKSLQIKKGDKVLVRGGSSSIGLSAIALCSYLGAEVSASIRPQSLEEKRQLLLDQGAVEVFADTGDFAIQGMKYDKILELVGASTLKDSLLSLQEGGICCFTGILGNEWLVKDFSPFEYIISGTYLTTYASHPWVKEEFAELIFLVEKEILKPTIYKTISLQEVREAHRIMEEGKAQGKIVLLP